MLGFYQHFSYGWFCWLSLVYITAGLTLSVLPSSRVTVNQNVTLLCELDANLSLPFDVSFVLRSPSSTLSTICTLVLSYWECMNTTYLCMNGYDAACINTTQYSIQVNVPSNWSGASVLCRTPKETSNSHVFFVEEPVSSVTLLSTTTTFISGQQMNLTCATSYCYPPANITWYMSSDDVTHQSTSTINSVDGLAETISMFISTVGKEDTGKRAYCTASNTPDKTVTSNISTLNVLYKPEVSSRTSKPYIVKEGESATLSCTVTDANPYTDIIWRWFKTDSPNNTLHNGPNYTISNIQRGRSGTYNCSARNVVGTSENATIEVDVLYKPDVRVSTSGPYRLTEGTNATLVCTVTDANPNTNITWRWVKTNSLKTILHSGQNYSILNIQKNETGLYNCTASNIVGRSEATTVYVDVLYKPSIAWKGALVVNESSVVNLTREISSNPLSNASWYDGSKLLVSEMAVNTTTLIIHAARCTDTKNFTLTASNLLQLNVTSLVELIVNCKPSSEIHNITLGVSDDTGIAFSITISAYPRPHYVLLAENGSVNYEMVHSMSAIAVNKFTIHFSKTTVKLADFGTFVIYISNTFGTTSIYVNVIPQRKPTAPRILEVICKARSAKVQWMSSFNGGDSQMFTVHAFLVQQEASRSEPIHDEGENKLHNTQIQNIQPSTTYTIYVVAKNKHGNSSSEKMKCNTVEEKHVYTSNVPIVGGSLAGTLLLVTLILITVFLIRRRYTCPYFGRRKRDKPGEANGESPHYTGMAEYENTQRNVYDELRKNQSEYEDVSMEERDINNANMYEDIGSTAEQVPSEDQSNVLFATAGITLTVIPSNDVAENQTVTLQCELDPNPIPPFIVSFFVKSSTLCQLEPSNGVCRNTTDPCRIIYNAFCPSETRYSIQVNVTRAWSGASVVCQTIYEQSNKVVFSVKVPVTSVTLTPTSITVTDGQQMNLTCTTSASNPQANITWHKSSRDITSQSTSTTEEVGGLARTVSSLQSIVGKEDNGKQIYCRASNTPNHAVTSNVQLLNVQYKPEVRSSLPSPYTLTEGQTATLVCTVISANPSNLITWKWFKSDTPNTVLHTGSTYTIHNIQRGRSGSYNCTASNAVGTSEPATIYVDVWFGPSIQIQAVMIVNETERAVLTGKIYSNPLSTVSWYDGSRLLKFEDKVNTTYLIIEKASCTDTRTFELTASNVVRMNVTSSIPLIVNCKPVSDVSNITLGVTDDTGIVFSTTVIAYPRPQYALLFENGTKTRDILDSIDVNAINNFTIHFNKTRIKQDDLGFYRLYINNTFGETVIYVAVLPQRTPNSPRNVNIICSVKSAKIQWRSSFNGGVTQTFKALVIFKQGLVSQSEVINDYGENVIHNTQFTNLQPTTKYTFYVVAQNKHGNSSSEGRECTTLEEPRNQAPLIAASTLGSVGLVVFILVAVFCFHRRYTCNLRFQRRKGSTNSKDNEELSHYTTITEHENTERNVYDELTQGHSRYESVLVKDREENKKIYEKLQKLENGNEVHLYDKTNVHSAEGYTKPLHDRSTKGFTSDYMNTSLTQ
uniref:Hemicentin-1-like isoform X3 n=1 Tax=Crassostrea virginica TaxID=6565 RepID=A0A8B8AA12_CRAVI|nr:hemicentin-1-like isoform X3 [Crassostrea virginica]